MISLGVAADPSLDPSLTRGLYKTMHLTNGYATSQGHSYLEPASCDAFPCGLGIYSEFHPGNSWCFSKFPTMTSVLHTEQVLGHSSILWSLDCHDIYTFPCWASCPGKCPSRPPPLMMRISYWPAWGSSWGYEPCHLTVLATRMGFRPNRAN